MELPSKGRKTDHYGTYSIKRERTESDNRNVVDDFVLHQSQVAPRDLVQAASLQRGFLTSLIMAQEVIVLDPGSSSFKAGFSGQDLPQSSFPSVWVEGQEHIKPDKSRRPEVGCYHRSCIYFT